MSTERDELAAVIREAYLFPKAGEPAVDSLRAAERLIAAGYRKLEPVWAESLEHDDTHEFTSSSHCNGEHYANWRRTPKMSATVEPSPWVKS